MNYLNSVMSYDLNSANNEVQHIYYDISIVNNSVSSEPVPLDFNESRSAPFLDDPAQWFVTVVRWHIDTANLPVFVPAIQTGQSDVNLTAYSFTLKYKTYEVQTYVSFSPQNVYAKIPQAPLTKQDMTTDYYYVYSYSYFVDLCNIALQTCVTDLNTLVVAGSDTLPSTIAPWIQYDPSSSSFYINCDILGYADTLTNPIEIYMNGQMYNLYNGFEAMNYGYSGIVNGKNFKLAVRDSYTTNVIDLDTYNAISLSEEYPSIELWGCVSSIQFTTSSLPIEGSITGVPKVYNSASAMNVYAQNNSAQILTDFVVSGKGSDYLPAVDYVATGLYRFCDLFGHSALSNMQLSVKWVDRFNNSYPVYLSNGSRASIKLLFRKKHLKV